MADGSPSSQEWFSRYFAQRGYLVVAIDYRHAPEWKWPEQIVDVRSALYWVSENSSRFGGDPSRIVVVGRSAGAQLAMRLAYQEGPSSIRAVVNLYGPVDLADGWRHPPRPDPANVRGILECLLAEHPIRSRNITGMPLRSRSFREQSPRRSACTARATTSSKRATAGCSIWPSRKLARPQCCWSFHGPSTHSTLFRTDWAGESPFTTPSALWPGRFVDESRSDGPAMACHAISCAHRPWLSTIDHRRDVLFGDVQHLAHVTCSPPP